jgi:hypothetical protein
VREFGRLYRRTAADLAIAREEVRDQRLVNYLNHLVARAHGAIYRSESSGFGVFVSFFRYEFPAVFRKTFRYTMISFAVFMLSAALAYAACFFDEGFADRIDPGLREAIASHTNWTEAVNRANPLASTSIQANNITVTFVTFAGRTRHFVRAVQERSAFGDGIRALHPIPFLGDPDLYHSARRNRADRNLHRGRRRSSGWKGFADTGRYEAHRCAGNERTAGNKTDTGHHPDASARGAHRRIHFTRTHPARLQVLDFGIERAADGDVFPYACRSPVA